MEGRLFGHDVIAFSRKTGRTLSRLADSVDVARGGLSVLQAELIARRDPSLIYVDVPDDDEPRSFDCAPRIAEILVALHEPTEHGTQEIVIRESKPRSRIGGKR